MNEGLKKFKELLLTDQVFQQKLKAAAESYDGEQTEEAVFNNVLIPLASEYGISASYDEYKEFITNPDNLAMSDEELVQVAGGYSKGGGTGGGICAAVGFGVGGAANEEAGTVCLWIGLGWGNTSCFGVGNAEGL